MVLNQDYLLLDPTKIYEEPISSTVDEIFTNSYGSVRRSKVYPQYKLENLTLKEVVDLYRIWRDDHEYFILKGYPEHFQQDLSGNNKSECECLYKFIKASKRGNDIYKHLVEQKLKPLNELPDFEFGDHTSLLFVTLTYDKKRCGVKQGWKNIGEEFHLFINNLRKQYGKIEFFRTWESTGGYYPHVHCIILFWDHSFPVLKHEDKTGEVTFRIPYKQKKDLGKYWHSNIDIQAVKSTNGAIRELTKYITKDLCSDKGDITNSMIWLFGKQGYAISKGFIASITGWDIEFNEPTNHDLINQMCNCNQDVIKWEFVGVLRGKHLGFSSQLWCIDLKKPPPKIMDLIKLERKRWLSLHGTVTLSELANERIHNTKNFLRCDNCGSHSDIVNVLGVWVCKKCLQIKAGGE